MPLCENPDATIPYVLKLDRDKPEGMRPTFHLRFLTFREDRQLEAIQSQMGTATGDEEIRLANEAIHTTLARWEGMKLRGEPVTYEKGKDVTVFLTPNEVFELANAARLEPIVTERDRKNSVSPAQSAPAQSVAAVGQPAA